MLRMKGGHVLISVIYFEVEGQRKREAEDDMEEG